MDILWGFVMENLEVLFNLSSECHHALYCNAMQKITIGLYARAISILKLLIVIAPNEIKYKKLLAYGLYCNENYLVAANYYLDVYKLSPKNQVECLIFAAESVMKIALYAQAIDLLELCLTTHAVDCNDNLLAKAKLLHKIAQKNHKSCF